VLATAQEEREAREVARGALALLSDWLEHAGGAKRPGAGRNRILEGPTLDALARLRPPTAAALADLHDVPRLSQNKRKHYGEAIVAALLQARPLFCALCGIRVRVRAVACMPVLRRLDAHAGSPLPGSHGRSTARPSGPRRCLSCCRAVHGWAGCAGDLPVGAACALSALAGHTAARAAFWF